MFKAPFPPHALQDKSGLGSHETLVIHWQATIANLVDHIHRLIDGALAGGSDDTLVSGELGEAAADLKINGGEEIISKIPEDGDFYVDEYNFELEKLSRVGKNTWFVGPWLFAESYPYRLIRSYFKRTTYWTDFDPFRAKKEEAFRNSATAVYREH
ncbi:hypothetical protein EDD16DRAFT_1901045 [Pisolithus croceorrhizus]|nr:hypothetical protein EDD16DRAFT_1901045 [Pisolithus croceorrhizus]